MLTSNSSWFGTIHSYRTLHNQAYLIVWVKGPEMRCVRWSTLVYHPMISRSTKYRWIFNHFSRRTISRCIFNHNSRSTRTIYQCFFNHISRSTIYRCIFNHISRSTIYRCIFNHISRSTLNQWLFNTMAISPGNPNSNAYSIIKITIDQCCSNVAAINIR